MLAHTRLGTARIHTRVPIRKLKETHTMAYKLWSNHCVDFVYDAADVVDIDLPGTSWGFDTTDGTLDAFESAFEPGN